MHVLRFVALADMLSVPCCTCLSPRDLPFRHAQLGRVREEVLAPGVNRALNNAGLNTSSRNAAYAL